MIISHPSKNINIGKRLKTVADSAAVRLSCENDNTPLRAIDVGTDHAKLPMYLVSNLGFCHVTATDINEGPCKSANANIGAAGSFFADRIDVIRTDGLSGLDGVECDRIIIAGMGGELIRDILSGADFVRAEKERIGFVLQPQSKQEHLRRYLCSSGYRITDEKWVEDAGKIYCVISAVYDGVERKSTLLELYFGAQGLDDASEVFMRAFLKKYETLKKNLAGREGKKSSGRQELFEEDKRLLCEMEQYLKNNRKV